jgi:hypothetical protein
VSEDDPFEEFVKRLDEMEPLVERAIRSAGFLRVLSELIRRLF